MRCKAIGICGKTPGYVGVTEGYEAFLSDSSCTPSAIHIALAILCKHTPVGTHEQHMCLDRATASTMITTTRCWQEYIEDL